MKYPRLLLIVATIFVGMGAASIAAAQSQPDLYQVISQYPHDSSAFTEGLIYENGKLYESTGLFGSSTLRKVDLITGAVITNVNVPAQYFAEGMTLFQGKIFQLTWQSHVGFIYDPATFAQIGQFSYAGEGWGLTHDSQYLIMSDGTSQIRFLDPTTFQTVRTINVTDLQGNPLTRINELEYINGEIFANIWQTNLIVRIDPATGAFRGWLDLTGLLPAGISADVLNGIAYDNVTRHLLVTGKLWPYLYELELGHANDWLQFGGDPQHSGRNTAETAITRNNVSALVQKYQVTLPATADGAPVFLEAINTPTGTKDLLFVTTRDGRIIAVDAQNGAQVWARQYGPGTCQINLTGGACYTTSSPAIDPNRQYVYSYGLDGNVHKYQVGDGTEITGGGWPQLATLKGFDEKGSSALATATSNGTTYLYVVHGGYPGDNGDYQGHVTAINLATGAQKVFNAACSDQTVHFKRLANGVPPTCSTPRNAIWSRPGVIYDAGSDRIFMGTGNGVYDGNRNWSESVIALNPDGSGGSGVNAGKPLDSYTPANFQNLDNGDTDLGSTAPAILPVPANSIVQNLAVQSGKDSKLRLINLANLSGQGGPGHVGGEIGTIINVPQGGVVLTQPAVWINPADGTTWVFVVNGNGASGLQLVVDVNGNPSLAVRWQNVQGGTSPIVANNMVFSISGSTVRALDPLSGNVLWSLARSGGFHWESLIVAKGVVYATDSSNRLTAYAIAPGSTTTALTSSANPAALGASVTFTATVNGTNPTGNVNFKDGANSIAGCAAVALTGSGNTRTTACSTSSLSAGTHSIVAVYGGDAGNATSSSPALSQVINSTGTDVVWVDEAVPAGAILASDGDSWNWVSSNPAPYSGALAHQSALLSGLHQHYFYNATATLSLAVGDTLFAYVYLDPANPPSEVMLQWNDGSWEHRAYWGANLIGWGTNGTVSRRFMGALPSIGQWVRLSVPAAQVGLEGRTLNGMAYTLYGGRATWDFAGKTATTTPSYQVSGTVTLSGAALSGVSFAATGGVSCTNTNAAGSYTCTVPQGWSGTITPSLSGYTFTPPSRSYTSVAANQTAQNYTAAASTGTTVWVEDAVPAGATLASDGDSWSWVSSNPAPYSGALAHQSAVLSGLHQHYFYNATATLTVAAGDTLFAYVYLDPANPPSEVMLQWYDGSWDHRAYWGANLIGWGINGTVSRRFMGVLPAAGQWVRLSVPAAQVGLEGRTLNGMAYTLYGGRATWDYAGK